MQEEGPRRNEGTPLDLEWIRGVGIDEGEVERSAEDRDAPGRYDRPGDTDRRPRHAGPGGDEPARLLRVVSCIDLTTLSGDDTPARVQRLCAEARDPLPSTLRADLGTPTSSPTVAAVCVFHEMVETALKALEGSGIPVAAVSAGFPHGLSPLPSRLTEIRASVSAGAREIDAVIPRFLALEGRWEELYDTVSAYRDACRGAHLKIILSTGELGSLATVLNASLVSMMAGADFIKTSTGKERVNASFPAGLVMARAIREYGRHTGYVVGLKPAGGIRKAHEALKWLALAMEELGEAWTGPTLFRIGASSLLADVVRELERVAR